MKNIIWVALIVFAFMAGRLTAPKEQIVLEDNSTTISIDTALHTAPQVRDSVVLRFQPIPVPKYEYKDSLRLVTDTIYDTIQIPIVQKIYSDSTYKAWVSGYNPSLDSIEIYNRTISISNTKIKLLNKRWGIGIQTGVGLKDGKMEPYIGVGISYNILCF